MKDEEAIKVALDRALGGKLNEELWEFLEEEGYVSAVIDPNEDEDFDFNYLAAKARKILAIRGLTQPGNAPRMLTANNEEQTEGGRLKARQKALSIIYADLASQDERVVQFRRQILGNIFPLAFEHVEEWLKSQCDKELKDDSSRGGLLEYSIPNNAYLRCWYTVKDGVLDRLQHISEELANTYNWTKAQAAVFILTDIPPIVPHYEIEWKLKRPLLSASRIKLILDPVLTPKEVSTIYQKARQSMLKKDRAGKARFRTLLDKTYRLAIFEAKQPEGRTDKEKMKIWNKEVSKEQPDWTYPDEYRFGRDAKKAVQRLLQPEYFDWEGMLNL